MNPANPAVQSVPFTRADYLRLPEGFPAQLIRGELVKDACPEYGHQRVQVALVLALRECVTPDRIFPAPTDVPIDEFDVYQPDVSVFRTPPPDEERGTRVPCVVFEILSRTTEARDREIKTPGYLEAGVEEVWLVDRRARTIEVRTRDGSRIARGAEAAVSGVLTGFAVSPTALLSPSR